MFSAFRAGIVYAGFGKGAQRFSIYVLTHVIGDIHQPLHAADDEDRGANEIRVKLPDGPNNRLNLHSFWDTEIVERTYGNESDVAVAKKLIEKYKSNAAAWRKGTFKDWVAQSHQIARDQAYGRLPGFSCMADMEDSRISLPDAYLAMAQGIIDAQLAKAGCRLAYVLNRAFDE